MRVEKLSFGCKDFKERKFVYTLLAKLYVAGKKMENPFTQRELLFVAEDITGFKLYEETLRKYIKEEKTKSKS